MLHIMELKNPITAVWEITDNCNFKCPHCRAGHEIQCDDEELENRILSEIINSHILSVNLSGGEPLLNPRIQFILEKLVKNGIDTGVSSNGWLFVEKADKLIEKGLSFLQVSVDGIPTLHEKFRGFRGSYQRAIEALKYAKKVGIRTQMNVTITALNIDMLDYNIFVAKELGIDRIFFRRVVPEGLGNDNRYVLPKKSKYIETIKKIMNVRIEGLDIAIDDPIVNVIKGNKENVMGCTAGIKSIGISSNGNVYPCIFFRHCIGNLKTENLIDIWKNSDVLKKLRNRDIGKCGECNYKYICGGCRAYSGLEEQDEMCPIM